MTGHPIDTCPKDGSEFLAYDPVARKFDVCLWRGNEPRATQYDHEYGPLSDQFQDERATLWWPLPDV